MQFLSACLASASGRWAALVVASLIVVTPAGAATVAWARSDNGAAVPARSIETTLSRSGLVARLSTDATAEAYGLAVTAAEPAIVYFSVSSEYVIAAVLSGTVTTAGRIGDRPLVPGEMAYVQQKPGARPSIDEFSTSVFMRAPPKGLPASVSNEMKRVAALQEKKIFWGALQRTSLNVQSPVPPLVEGLRRDYMLEPTIVRIRQSVAPDSAKLAVAAAESFIAAMGRRDVGGVRALLHPTMFLPGTSAPTGNWLLRRHVFAASLTSGPLPAQMSGARISVDIEGRIIASSGARRWEITTAPLEAFVFVTALEAR